MDHSNNNQTITPESVLATIKAISAEVKTISAEVKEMFATSREEFAASRAESMAEFHAMLAASSAKFDRELAESRAEHDRQMKSLKEHMAGLSDSQGEFAEDYFFNSLENGHINFFIDEKIDKVLPNVKGRTVNDEYDILFINGKTAGIVECKFKARKDDISKMLKKPDTFRANFPEYQNHKVFLALAALTINQNIQRECIKQGIAIIKQVGDTIVVKNEHLKVF